MISVSFVEELDGNAHKQRHCFVSWEGVFPLRGRLDLVV